MQVEQSSSFVSRTIEETISAAVELAPRIVTAIVFLVVATISLRILLVY